MISAKRFAHTSIFLIATHQIFYHLLSLFHISHVRKPLSICLLLLNHFYLFIYFFSTSFIWIHCLKTSNSWHRYLECVPIIQRFSIVHFLVFLLQNVWVCYHFAMPHSFSFFFNILTSYCWVIIRSKSSSISCSFVHRCSMASNIYDRSIHVVRFPLFRFGTLQNRF